MFSGKQECYSAGMAQAYVLYVETATGDIKGRWNGDDAGGLPDMTAHPTQDAVQVPEAVYRQSRQKRKGQRSQRYRWDAGTAALVENDDQRLRLVITPTAIDADVGDAPETLAITAVRSNGNPRTNFNGRRRVRLFGRDHVRLNFTAGVATVQIPTDEAIDEVICDNDDLVMHGGGEVTVVVANTELKRPRR